MAVDAPRAAHPLRTDAVGPATPPRRCRCRRPAWAGANRSTRPCERAG